jgi:hypothetical protein
MQTLRITQKRDTTGFHVNLFYDNQNANAAFDFTITDEQQRRMRWYLEDFLQNPEPPADQRAREVEAEMQTLGSQLFEKVFESDKIAQRMWAKIMDEAKNVRVELYTGVEAATALPWELLHDSTTGRYLALEAYSFVRVADTIFTPLNVNMKDDERLRILLVICRPSGRNDVPFRSVAARLLKGLDAETREQFQLDVLRPASFDALARRLHDAKAAGKPYHVVHFDGHGTYTDASKVHILRPERSAVQYHREGRHGYLIFENPEKEGGIEFVDGRQLGELLHQTDAPILVLNACQSAYAEAPPTPEDAPPDTPRSDDSSTRQGELKAFGSLAQEVVNAGVGGVVAMRYTVYVVTAAQFVAELYAQIGKGLALGEAVSAGRKHLRDKPQRQISYADTPTNLQDWSVPVVYESQPLQLRPKRDASGITINLQAGQAAQAQNPLDSTLPAEPDIGFWGRDDALLALDRAFDKDAIVLLRAYAGSGKTTTAAEFARWYALTGGLKGGAVIFSSFFQKHTLSGVLADFGRVFAPTLAAAGREWNAIVDPDERRDLALRVLQQIPVLWVWDNVEPIAGFPAGTPSAWTDDEQSELKQFLQDAAKTKAKFLLTSRREERKWLGMLYRDVEMYALMMLERVAMAQELARRANQPIKDVRVWLPLLRYSDGNPLTLRLLMLQALRAKLATKDAILQLVDQLRAGAAKIQDEASEKRDASLAASLSYGFEQAFSATERARIALLHLFQGFVDVDTLVLMGDEDLETPVPVLHDFSREKGIVLLDKAVEIGLLREAGGGYYHIHPALPWYLESEFQRQYPDAIARTNASRAYAEAIGELGNLYFERFNQGQREYINLLEAEEANLLHARRLALQHAAWQDVMAAMQGLQTLYEFTGRTGEWRPLVDEIVPLFCQPDPELPLPERSLSQWSLVMQYRVNIAKEDRHWQEAERLQQIRTEQWRQAAQPYASQADDVLDAAGRGILKSLAVSLEALGSIQREQEQATCVPSYNEAIKYYQRIGNTSAEANAAFNLGHAYKNIAAIRDLEQAHHWYRRSLELTPEGDNLGRAGSLAQLGSVAYLRFMEAQDAEDMGKAEEYLIAALQYYLESMEINPPEDVTGLAINHHQLGMIYKNAGQSQKALYHYQLALHFHEQSGSIYNAAQTRRNMALLFLKQGELTTALAYAQAALSNFQQYGERTLAEQQQMQQLIAAIQQEIDKKGQS